MKFYKFSLNYRNIHNRYCCRINIMFSPLFCSFSKFHYQNIITKLMKLKHNTKTFHIYSILANFVKAGPFLHLFFTHFLLWLLLSIFNHAWVLNIANHLSDYLQSICLFFQVCWDYLNKICWTYVWKSFYW